MRISDWSSDVCSSDLVRNGVAAGAADTDDADPGMKLVNLRTDEIDAHCWSPLLDTLRDDAPLLTLLHDAIRGRKQKVNLLRSEERRVGKACVSTCRSRWSRMH